MRRWSSKSPSLASDRNVPTISLRRRLRAMSCRTNSNGVAPANLDQFSPTKKEPSTARSRQMAENKDVDPNAVPRSAADLRMILLQEQLAEAKKFDQQKQQEQKKLTAFTDDFLKGHVTEDEVAMVRRLVMN